MGTFFEGLPPAERLLRRLGVSSPDEIDVDAVAYSLGVLVERRPLNNCEAQIVGAGDRAVAFVNSRSAAPRQRFSIAHELGHWHHHRGQTLVCRTPGDTAEHHPRAASNERLADRYAADLLLPSFLFDPMAAKRRMATVEVAEDLGRTFSTSLTATLIRLVERGPEPALLVSLGKTKRNWFTKNPRVDTRYFPRTDVGAESRLLPLLYGGTGRTARAGVSGDVWFDFAGAERIKVAEQGVRIGDNEVLAIIVLL